MPTRFARLALLFVIVSILPSCGGGSTASSPPPPPPPPRSPDFSLVVESASVMVQQGGGLQFETVQANPVNGFTGTINLALSGLPTGVTLIPSGSLSIVVTGGSQGTAFQMAASPSTPTGTTTVTATGTSGTITHTITFSLTVSQAAPFSIQVSPASVSLTTSSTAPVQITVTAAAGTSPQLRLSITEPPNNSQINLDLPQGFLTPTDPQSFSFVATSLAQPLQNFPIVITASDDSNNTSIVTLPLTLTIPFASNATPTRSTFARTDQSPTGMVYDQARKLLFVSVEVLNEVVVLSSVDGHLVSTIPVNYPAGIDEAADGSAVYVVSPYFGYITIIDPGLLQVIGHASVPESVSGSSEAPTFLQVAALSNGKVLLLLPGGDATQPPFVLWDPAAGTFSRLGQTIYTPGALIILRSEDHSKVLAYGGFSNGAALVYDAVSNKFNGPGTTGGLYWSINSDGSQMVAVGLQDSPTIFFDANFNVLKSLHLNVFPVAGATYSSDGKHVYVLAQQGASGGDIATVIDAKTFAVVGVVPGFSFGASLPFSGNWITTFATSESNILFGAAFRGVGFLDMSSPTFLQEPLPAPFQVEPSLASLGSPTQAQLSGAGFTQNAMLSFFVGPPPASPQSLEATNLSVKSTNLVNLTIPAGKTPGAANATLMRSDGFFEVMPDAVSFGPTIIRVDADAGSPSGGDTIQIVGYGLDSPGTQVTIGGKPATSGQTKGSIPGALFPTERLFVTTPPGTPGMADVEVSTLSGSATIPGGFQYLNSLNVYPMVGALDAITYDQLRKRLYITNEDHNRVEVFDLGTNTFLAPIAVGNSPAALALTPDSSLLAVLNRADSTVSVVNLAKVMVTATYTALSATDGGMCGGMALNISPAEPHRMLVDVDCSFLLAQGNFHLLNLDTGSLTCTGIAGCAPNGTDIGFDSGLAAMASTADGKRIFLAGNSEGGSDIPVGMLDLVANTLKLGFGGNFADAAVNADGTRFAATFELSDSQLERTGIMAYEVYADTGGQSAHNVFGEKLNPSGSLLFYPQDSGVDVFDTHTGRLVRHIILPDPIPLDSNGMALDETGTKLFLISNTGITIAQLFEAPLSLAAAIPAAGTPGTTVKFRGSGFQNGAAVVFGTIQVSATFVDQNTLQATVPTLPAGSIQITIKNPDGHQYELDNSFTVN